MRESSPTEPHPIDLAVQGFRTTAIRGTTTGGPPTQMRRMG
ncbi:hypothetical protein [Actinoplanes solisilvae]|nr:hypothetical protein [Actinoplanes solisilvae]